MLLPFSSFLRTRLFASQYSTDNCKSVGKYIPISPSTVFSPTQVSLPKKVAIYNLSAFPCGRNFSTFTTYPQCIKISPFHLYKLFLFLFFSTPFITYIITLFTNSFHNFGCHSISMNIFSIFNTNICIDNPFNSLMNVSKFSFFGIFT